MKEDKNMKCDPCEKDFKHKVNELVKEGTAPSHMERERKEHEVKAAFTDRKPTGHSMPEHMPMGKDKMNHDAKPEAGMHKQKHPEMAGMGKMKK